MCAQCNICTDTGPPVLSPRRLGNNTNIPVPEGIVADRVPGVGI